tara:strand:- start:9021 stop:11312 length:2292 start_codon:yes stop_codon:yes gene_type:complete
MAEANRRQAVDPKLYQRKTEYEADVDYGAEISKITEPIGLEIANREAQKDKIQSDYEAVEEQLQNFEFDQESDNSALVLDLVNKAKAANYNNNQLVINGKIPPIDGQKRQARISNQMKEAGKANKTWNENLENKSKRATDLISAPSEIAATDAINQFSNTKGLQSYVDDTGNIWTYRADTRKEIEDPDNPGQMIKNPDFNKTPDFKTQPGKFIAYSRINEQMQYESNRANFDVGAIIGAKNKELGNFITSMGLKTTVDGVTGRSVLTKKSLAAINSNSDLKKLWDTYKENTSNTLTYDNEAVANILALNEGYQIVLSQEDFDELKKTDPELRDDQMILMNTLESPPTFTFKGGQDVATNAAKDVVKNQIDVDMGFVEERSSTQFPPGSDVDGSDEKENQLGYANDVNNIMSADSSTASAVSQDRINNMNDQFKDAGSKERITQIERDPNFIFIAKRNGKDVTIDKYEKDKNGAYITDKPRSEKDVAREVYRNILPKDAKDKSFDQWYKEAQEQGFSFTPRMIQDPDDKNKMIKNPKFKGDELTSTSLDYEEKGLYRSDEDYTNPLDATSGTIGDEFASIPDENNNYIKAATVVEKAFKRGTDGLKGVDGKGLDVAVTTIDDSGATNTIQLTFTDPVTGKRLTKDFKYDKDNAKLKSEVEAEINSIRQNYDNKYKGSSRGGKGIGRNSSIPAPSDIRLKENITLVGKSKQGNNIYTWNYKNQKLHGKGLYEGVIAQEVLWATVLVDNYLYVDYSKIDVDFNKIS